VNPLVIFYSWQSDLPAKEGKNFVGSALDDAVQRIAEDVSIELRPQLDQDTKGIPGSPNMSVEIFGKIDRCSVFVADVTLTFRRDASSRVSPNPNVLVELGYAVKGHGWPRVLQVMNRRYGGPEVLPFDLRGHRAITFDLGVGEEVESVRANLSRDLEQELRLILSSLPTDQLRDSPIELDLAYKKRSIKSERHEYRLVATAKNHGTRVIRDWEVEIRIPRSVLEPNLNYPIIDHASSNKEAVMRWTEKQHSGPIYPGDVKEVIGLDYYMDGNLFWTAEQTSLFEKPVQVTFFVNGEVAARVTKPFGDLQIF
jgi:hypothetical protein